MVRFETDNSHAKFAPGRGAEMPRVSVVVPVRNELACILGVLDQLLAQDYDPERFEILVVDGESSDGTPQRVADFARRHGNVRLLSNPGRLSSAARNIGVRNATGEVIVVVDGHCELDDDQYLKQLVEAFEHSGADCVGRPQPLDVSSATPLQEAIAAARSSPLGHHPDSFIYSSVECFVPAESVAVAYRKEVFETVGLFDERFDACEDVEFNHRVDRAGLRCYFTPRVAVRYRPRASLGGLFRQLVRYGRGRIRLLRKHPDTLGLGTLLPLLLLLGVVAGLPLALTVKWLLPLYVAGLTAYAGAVSTAALVAAVGRRSPALFARLLLVFPVIHFASGFGMLMALLEPWRRTPKNNC